MAVTDTTAEFHMSPSLSPRTRRLIRSYGLLVLIAIAFMLLAMFVRTVERTEPVDEGFRRSVEGLVS